MEAFIYGLVDPTTQRLRYVGRTIQPLEMRLRNHIDVSRRKSNSAKSQWIRSLLAAGFKPEIFEIERVSVEASPEAEGVWMAYFRYVGAELLNEQSHNVGGHHNYIVDWTEERIARLGKIPDEEYAKELGVDRKTIEYKRRRLGIAKCGQRYFVPPPPMGGWNRIELPQHIIDRLGTMSDRQLGKEIGVSKKTILEARRVRGIPDYSATHGHPTRFKSGNGHKRWDKPGARAEIPQHAIDRLGIVSDTKLAQELGVSRDAIAKRRKALGIPSIKQQCLLKPAVFQDQSKLLSQSSSG